MREIVREAAAVVAAWQGDAMGIEEEGRLHEERIMALEETVAHHGRVIEELSGQLAEQWKVLEQTRNKLDRLTERFLSLEEQALEAPAITKPPHY